MDKNQCDKATFSKTERMTLDFQSLCSTTFQPTISPTDPRACDNKPFQLAFIWQLPCDIPQEKCESQRIEIISLLEDKALNDGSKYYLEMFSPKGLLGRTNGNRTVLLDALNIINCLDHFRLLRFDDCQDSKEYLCNQQSGS